MTWRMMFLKPLSMSRNFLASDGSCRWMSGAEKMGSARAERGASAAQRHVRSR